MGRNCLVSGMFFCLILGLSNTVFSFTRIVSPAGPYYNIQSAIDASASGDKIVVNKGTYYIRQTSDVNVVNFKNKSLTIQSQYPTDADYVAQTIIDGQGLYRLVSITNSGASASSRLEGFTLRNGYANGGKGQDASTPTNRRDPCDVFGTTTGDGRGGGIYIGANCNPVINRCIITDCLVAGAVGGNGAKGFDGNSTTNGGMRGGKGGAADGNGLGAGIYVGAGSKPIITYCTIKNNTAKGAIGGNGGTGGSGNRDAGGTATGQAGSGGDGGSGNGDSRGAGIYCETGADPKIDNCTFSNNLGISGQGGQGGAIGAGTSGTPPNISTPGADGSGTGSGGGAAAYHSAGSDPNYLACTFSTNLVYTTGSDSAGGVYVVGSNTDANFTNCAFNSNSPGAMRYFGDKLHLTNCIFNSNTGGYSGGALATGAGITVTMVGCSFGSNVAANDGGAVYLTNGTLNATDCTFSGNTADSSSSGGGGVYGDLGSSVTMNNCALTGNTSAWGGGLYLTEFNAAITDCYFINNVAKIGAGGYLAASNANFTITGSVFQNNSAKGADNTNGGGLCVSMCDGDITHTKFVQNYSQGLLYGDGAGIYIEASGLAVTDCLLANNSAITNGGGAAVTIYSDVTFNNCTFAQDFADRFGGGIFCDDLSGGSVENSIFTSCSKYGIYEKLSGLITPIRYNLFGANGTSTANQPADIYDGITDRTGAANINGIVTGASNNITADPKFVMTGPLGGFYLASDSPAINAGSAMAASLGLNTRTTRTNNVLDSGVVDLGFHYPNSTTVAQFNLKTSAPDLHGTLNAGKDGAVDPSGDASNPSGLDYYAGTIVPLTAVPYSGYRVKNWTGDTTNDQAKSRSNAVVMVANRIITVLFEQPSTLPVGGNSQYFEIQPAVNDAQEGDIIVVAQGTYRPETSIYVNKSITIKSVRPDDPCVVGETIIDGNAFAGNILDFGPNAGPDTVFNGLTIANGRYTVSPAQDAQNPGQDGGDGYLAASGGIYFYPGASPQILNTVIMNCIITGAKGGKGFNADATHDAGRGGWGGWARGGGAYINSNCKPVFNKCTIKNCSVTGGDGGNGGDFFRDTRAGIYRPGGYGGLWSSGSLWQQWGYESDFWFYTGSGGAVYCVAGSEPTFIDCIIRNNTAKGGRSGRGGANYASINSPPNTIYRLPSFGAGVFCEAGVRIKFTNCTIADNNTADSNASDFLTTPHIGSGGGVYFSGAQATFENCNFNSNESKIGGGLYCTDSNSSVFDCNFSQNRALEGGAVYVNKGATDIMNTRVVNNIAALPSGLGGGVVCFSSNASIADCNFVSNQAGVAAGGLYFSGSGSIMTVENSLFVNNEAGRDGGGLSADIFAQPYVGNCTFNGNIARGDALFTGGYGGALSCLYGANTTVKNSIMWNNNAPNGSEIAVGSGFNLNRDYATVNVSYSDIRLGQAGIYQESGSTVNWQSGNLNGMAPGSDPKWVTGSFYLSQTAAGQASTSPCVNAGTGTAAQLPLGAYRYTTRTDDGNDIGAIDMGYHYRKGGNFLAGDLNYDSVIDLTDVSLLITDYWLDSDCGAPDYCGGADLNHDGIVNGVDEAILAQGYGMGDVNAPAPDPMTWAVAPYSAGPTTIKMQATKARDNSGWNNVQYRCRRTNPDSTEVTSTWQNDPCFVVTGLSNGDEYGFEVQARDTGLNHNETGWSFMAPVVPGQDTSAPTNVTLSASNITATGFTLTASAQDATPPIMYEFTCTAGGGPNRAFGANTWTLTGLTNNTSYTYVVKAKDSLSNMSANSAPLDVNTSSSGGGTDTTPPSPNPLTWATPPTQSGGPRGVNPFIHTMTCTTATDASGPILYRFICLEFNQASSGWQSSTTYSVNLGLWGPYSYRWEVQAMDALGNKTNPDPTARWVR